MGETNASLQPLGRRPVDLRDLISPERKLSGRAAGARRRSGDALSVSLGWSLPLLLGTGLLLGSLALTLLFLLLLLGQVLLALLVLILGSGQFGSFQI